MNNSTKYHVLFIYSIIALAALSLDAQDIEETLPAEQSIAQAKIEEISDPAVDSIDNSSNQLDDEAHPTDIAQDEIQFNFQNSKLENLIEWISHVHGITFLTDESIKTDKTQPIISQAKISFQTQRPLSKKQSWDLFIAFLDIAGLAIVPGPDPSFYKITSPQNALTAALPTYIGVDPDQLPNNDAYVRYVYFLENTSQSMLNDLTNLLKTFMITPQNARLNTFQDLTALIFTEKATIIRSIMQIVMQLDKATSPEILRIIPLKYTNANDVVDLYTALASADDTSKRPFPGPIKEPTLFYFPENAKLIAEKRSNILIILGPKVAVDRIEEFVRIHVDKQLPPPDQTLQVAPLQYTNATQIANILNQVTQFGAGTSAQQYGSIIENQKYFKKMIFTADESTNSVVARATKEDWRYIKPIIQELDTIQPQVAIEVLIVTVSNIKNKQLGVQFRNKDKLLLGSNLDFQTSGLPTANSAKAPLIDPTTGSLMANLIGLATGHQPGTTLLTFGQPTNIWGILKMLETQTQTNVISSPFLMTTNKYQASVSLGRTKQVVTGTVVGGAGQQVETKGDLPANLEVKITPQINNAGFITLNIDINIEDFVNPESPSDAQRIKRTVKTTAIVLNKEVLALGGLIQKKVNSTQSNVPILGKIPILGWFFKNKSKSQDTENLLIFISPQIIDPTDPLAGTYTTNKANYARDVMKTMTNKPQERDPIHRWFFDSDKAQNSEQEFNNFMNKEQIGMTESEKKPLEIATPTTYESQSPAAIVPAQPIEPESLTAPKKRHSLISFMPEEA